MVLALAIPSILWRKAGAGKQCERRSVRDRLVDLLELWRTAGFQLCHQGSYVAVTPTSLTRRPKAPNSALLTSGQERANWHVCVGRSIALGWAGHHTWCWPTSWSVTCANWHNENPASWQAFASPAAGPVVARLAERRDGCASTTGVPNRTAGGISTQPGTSGIGAWYGFLF